MKEFKTWFNHHHNSERGDWQETHKAQTLIEARAMAVISYLENECGGVYEEDILDEIQKLVISGQAFDRVFPIDGSNGGYAIWTNDDDSIGVGWSSGKDSSQTSKYDNIWIHTSFYREIVGTTQYIKPDDANIEGVDAPESIEVIFYRYDNGEVKPEVSI